MSEIEQVIERIVRKVIAEQMPVAANDSNITVAEYARRFSLSQSTVRAAILTTWLHQSLVQRS